MTRPTLHRCVTLFGSTVLTTGRRTVAPLARGHLTTYPRVLSAAEWSALHLACQLCRLIPADQAEILVGDDMVDGHPGRKVDGKDRHRDPVRSSHGLTAWRYGHKGASRRSWWTSTAARRRTNSGGPTAPRPGS